MICNNCHTIFEEGIFCPECGTRYEEVENNTVILEQDNNTNSTENNSDEKKDKSLKSPNKVQATIIVIVLCALFTLFDMMKVEDKTAVNNANSNTATEKSTIAVTILVNYEKKGFAYNDDAIVYIDGTKMGIIEAGDTRGFQVSLEEGTHKIWVESDTSIRQNNSEKEKFTVSDDHSIYSFNLKEGALGLTISKSK